MRAALIWIVLLGLIAWALGVAAQSPLLAYRDTPYILAGLGGALALALLLVQPLLGLRALPNLSPARAGILHRVSGGIIVSAVLVHVGGLYLTSPPDTLDALLLVSPTPFSVYGVAALAALICTAFLAGLRQRIGLRRWRKIHYALALVVVLGSVVHALLIDGTMGFWSKLTLCTAVSAVTAYGVLYGRLIKPKIRR